MNFNEQDLKNDFSSFISERLNRFHLEDEKKNSLYELFNSLKNDSTEENHLVIQKHQKLFDELFSSFLKSYEEKIYFIAFRDAACQFLTNEKELSS